MMDEELEEIIFRAQNCVDMAYEAIHEDERTSPDTWANVSNAYSQLAMARMYADELEAYKHKELENA